MQERDSVFRAPSGGDWILLGLVALGLLGTGVYDWLRLGVDDHTGRAVFFGLALVALLWGAMVYIFKLSMCVLVGPHGISLVRGPWRTELFWRDTARLVERTLPDGGQRFRWVVVMARDGRELRVREDMVANYMRFRAEVYERYLLWRDHGGTWGASGTGPFTATDIVANTVAWWLFAGGLLLLPGLYFRILLPETGLIGLVLIGLTVVCCLEALATYLGRQTYVVGPKEITRKRPAQPTTHLQWRNVSRIDRARHPAGGVIRVAIAIGRLLMEIAARTDSRFKSFAWSPRVPEYLTLRGEGRHVQIRLHRLTRPDEMLAWVEYYERIARRGAGSPSQPVSPLQPDLSSRPIARSASAPGAAAPHGIPASAAGSGPVDPWAEGGAGELPVDAYPTELQPSVNAASAASAGNAGNAGIAANAANAARPPVNPFSNSSPSDLPPAVAAALAASDDERPEDDSWLWDTNKMPRVSPGSSSSNIFGRQPGQPQRANPESAPIAPSFTPPPTAGPVFTPSAASGGGAPAESAWWLNSDTPAPPSAPSWDAPSAGDAADIYPPVTYPNYPNDPNYPNYSDYAHTPNYPPAQEYQPAYPPPEGNQPPAYDPSYDETDYSRLASPPFVPRPDGLPTTYSEPPEEQGPRENELYDENLAQSQRWRKQQNWQPPKLPRFGPKPEDEDNGRKR